MNIHNRRRPPHRVRRPSEDPQRKEVYEILRERERVRRGRDGEMPRGREEGSLVVCRPFNGSGGVRGNSKRSVSKAFRGGGRRRGEGGVGRRGRSGQERAEWALECLRIGKLGPSRSPPLRRRSP